MADVLAPLLIACGRAVATPTVGTAQLRAAVAAVSDWDEALGDAARQGMLPLVCARVASAAGDLLDPAASTRIHTMHRAAAARALGAMRQLTEVVSVLGAAGVRVLPYKGPALALDAYGDAAQRESDDLDIVVVPADLEAASTALRTAGYRPTDGRSWEEARLAHDWQGHVSLSRTGDPGAGAADDLLPVELHWRFCDRKLPWTLDVARVISRARIESIAGTPILIPDSADQLLLVLLHAARHGWDRLEPFVCASALLARGVDADAFLARAREAGGVTAALAGLALAHEIIGAPVPGEFAVLTAARRRAVDDQLGVARDRMLARDISDARDAALHLALLDNFRSRLRYAVLGGLQPTPQDWAIVPLPRAFTLLYVPIRFARLAGRAGTWLFGRRARR